MKKQYQVMDFASKYAPRGEVYQKFMALMREYDGKDDVIYAFYDTDILTHKLREASE